MRLFKTLGRDGKINLKEIRKEIGEKAMLVKREKDFLLYSIPEWEDLVSRLKGRSIFDLETRRLQRKIVSSAEEVKFGKNGRILIPAWMRKELKKKKKKIKILVIA